MYELNRVGENTYYIDSPTNMGVYNLGNGEVCLIDSGNDKDAGKKALKLLEAAGFRLKMIINTHSHADHIGGNRLLQGRTGCEIYVPGEDCCYTNHTVLEPAYLFGARPFKELKSKFLFAPQSNAKPLEELELPDGLKTVRLDGHSYAMAAVGTSDGVWFLGDAVVGESTVEKYHVTYLYDPEKYLESLKAVRKLEGKLFIPSHSAPCEDIAPLVRLNAENTLEICETVLDICSTPLTAEEVTAEVFERYGFFINFVQNAIIGSTVRSYLSYLYDLGRLTAEFENFKLYWKKV